MRDRLSKVLLIAIALSTMGLLITGCASNSNGSPSSPVTVGSEAPDFTLSDLDGESVSLSDFSGRPVFVNFWNTGCPPCREEMPYLQEVYDSQMGSELVMLIVNIGESPATITTFLENNDLSLPIIIDADGAVARTYGLSGIPTTFFIDRDGIIKSKVIGAFPSKAAIDSRLSEIMH